MTNKIISATNTTIGLVMEVPPMDCGVEAVSTEPGSIPFAGWT